MRDHVAGAILLIWLVECRPIPVYPIAIPRVLVIYLRSPRPKMEYADPPLPAMDTFTEITMSTRIQVLLVAVISSTLLRRRNELSTRVEVLSRLLYDYRM